MENQKLLGGIWVVENNGHIFTSILNPHYYQILTGIKNLQVWEQ